MALDSESLPRALRLLKANFDARQNNTTVLQTEPEPGIKAIKSGIDRLRMATTAVLLGVLN